MRNGTEISLSVIAPVYNGQSTIRQCLEAVYASTFPDCQVAFEVIVVDDHSSDETANIVRAFPCKLLACAKNSGPAAARNLGAAHASGAILYFLDADILIAPDTLARVLEAFTERPELSALFGSFQRNTVPDNFVSVYKNYLHHYTHQTANESAATFCGGFGAIRRDAFRDCGGFDPKLRYLEDVELGMRMYRAGHDIRLYKSLQSTHLKRYSLAGLVRSDVLGRALPWTRIMLKQKMFRNDLNTRIHNVASVPVSYAALLSPVLLRFPWFHSSRPLLTALVTAFLTLNRGFLLFVLRERGPIFAAGAALMCWFGYLYSGAGAFAGLLGHLRQWMRGESSAKADFTEALPCEDRTL